MTSPTPTRIYETVHGSRAYGLARAGSDTDIKGVIVFRHLDLERRDAAPGRVELIRRSRLPRRPHGDAKRERDEADEEGDGRDVRVAQRRHRLNPSTDAS
jgi:hypothetical protein